jgi:hypothetical protein
MMYAHAPLWRIAYGELGILFMKDCTGNECNACSPAPGCWEYKADMLPPIPDKLAPCGDVPAREEWYLWVIFAHCTYSLDDRGGDTGFQR